MLNGFQHAVDVGQHLVVPEAQHAITMRLKQRGALKVRTHINRVLASIDLDHQLSFVAYEIRNVSADLNLPTKVTARHRQSKAQMPPKLLLGFSLNAPHRSRKSTLWRR